MDGHRTQPKPPRRRGRTAARVLRVTLLLVCCLLASVWWGRVGLASCLARRLLNSRGLTDVTFRLTRLSPWRVVVEDLRVGAPEPVLTIGRAEASFSLSELWRRRLSRLHVREVRTPLVIDGLRVRSPLQERLAAVGRPTDSGRSAFSAGEVSVYDVCVPVCLRDGAEVVTWRGDASLVAEPGTAGGDALPERYRVWAGLRDSGGVQGTLSGAVAPRDGAVTLAADLKVTSLARAAEWARQLAPDRAARLAAVPSNGTFSVRGSVALKDWTKPGSFEVAAEVGRGSVVALSKPEGWIRFQTLRVEASGTPQDVQCRLSAGVAGFSVGGQLRASQEEGRLLSMRGTARWLQTPSNRVARATLDSDLPGRSAARVLPAFLPLLGRMLTEGGTLRAEAELAQPQGGAWQGELSYTAEARRNALTLPAGRVGAGRVAVEGSLSIRDAAPGTLRADIRVEEGYFFRPGVSARGGGVMSLVSQPPYRLASGTFEGNVSETAALAKAGVTVPDGIVRFQGASSVELLASNPVWHVALQVPEFSVASRPGAAAWRATAGAAARIDYSPVVWSLDSEVWARDAAVAVACSGRVERLEAGLERFAAHVAVTDARPADPSTVQARVMLEASNGWSRAGDLFALEKAGARVPFTWSLAQGVVFGAEPSLTGQRLEAGGVRVLPDGLTLRAEDGCAEASFGAKVEGSALRASARARMPLSKPGECVFDLAVPLVELAPGDALAGLVKRVDPKAVVTGRLAGEARVSFPGSRPHVVGRVRVSEGTITRDRLEVSGLCAEAAFEGGAAFRTVERPVITFAAARAGNVRLDKGRIEFQVTPDEMFVDRLEVGWCKGSLQAYSIHLDRKKPDAQAVVYADRVDLGEALMMIMPFKGKVEGVLYGRFPVGITADRVKLSTGFLYSLPGQGGVLRLEDSDQMLTLLDRAGITGDVREPLSRALSDMDFTVIRMELEPKLGGEAVLRIKLDGKSNFKEWPAPVALNLNLHGPLEELLNLGLSVSRK